MKLIDVHAHLESSRFDEDLDLVIARFVEAGGGFVINSGTSSERNRECLALAEKYDVVKCSFGMYPVGNFSKDVDGELKWIEEHADVCVAIGEIGLDYSDEISSEGNGQQGMGNKGMEGQKDLFRKMLGLAKKMGKPVVIHSRKAELEVIEILEGEGMSKVVMHCFCGRKSLIKRCVANGWFFSVPPAIMRWDNFKMLVENVPLDKLLTETDAPYLGAVARERNEPVNVLVTLKEIARIKGLDVEEVGEKIFSNAEKLFGI